MFRSRTFTRLAAMLFAIMMAAGACSSDSDATATTSDESSAEADSSEAEVAVDEEVSADEEASADNDDSAGYALECEEAGAFGATLRGASGFLQQINEENAADLTPDYDGIAAAIDGLRPIEDVDGPLGSMSEGLDNMEADLAAAQEARYADIEGGYSMAAMNGVIVDSICGN